MVCTRCCFHYDMHSLLLAGVPGEVFYARNGHLNDYALSFNMPLKNDVTDIHFNWLDESTSGSADDSMFQVNLGSDNRDIVTG